jgi:hypothetical protein
MVTWGKRILAACSILFVLAIASPYGHAGELVRGEQKKADLYKAYSAFSQNCLGCHASVADPEKPGRTRDEWTIVVEFMHGYGLDLTAEEKALITELLYTLRPGMEKEAG